MFLLFVFRLNRNINVTLVFSTFSMRTKRLLDNKLCLFELLILHQRELAIVLPVHCPFLLGHLMEQPSSLLLRVINLWFSNFDKAKCLLGLPRPSSRAGK